MEPKKPGNSLNTGPEVLERKGVDKEQALQKVCNITVQNEMRGVLERMTTLATRRSLVLPIPEM